MDFKDKKAIYLQIAERICDEILLDRYGEDERIPSVREYASLVEVNVNTVMRSYEYLQSSGIIYNKRGIGYFVSPDAKKSIRTLRKEQFLHQELDDIFRLIYLQGIPIEEIVSMYKEYVKQQENKNV